MWPFFFAPDYRAAAEIQCFGASDADTVSQCATIALNQIKPAFRYFDDDTAGALAPGLGNFLT